ncbi:MAG: hypothetical protein R2823_02955 [Acidimicrobiia bacterium]
MIAIQPRADGGSLALGFGAIGLLMSIVVAVAAWLLVDAAIDTMAESLDVTADVLVTVDDSIVVMSDTLDRSLATLDEIVLLSEDVRNTIKTTSSILISADVTISQTVPSGIDAIRAPLPELRSALARVEQVLGSLSFVGIDFTPEPGMTESLDRIDDELADLAAQLTDPDLRLTQLEPELAEITHRLEEVETRIESLRIEAEEGDSLFEAYEDSASRASLVVEDSRRAMDDRRTLARALAVAVGLALALANAGVVLSNR